ncbi:MAG: FdhF/YdeP family oxidoreductase [Alkalinema sp. RU_4_3]|nr:FdhF/YdeP family oxidoreductase [Alkalinema sp. RU_4_3]
MDSPQSGCGLPIVQYWAAQTLTSQGPKLWQTLLHKSACLSCAWGTGGQKGGFTNEDGEVLQRCAKSVEAIASELQPATKFHEQFTLPELQQLDSQAANNLGRFSQPLILRGESDRYEPLSWKAVYQLTAGAFRPEPARLASYSSGRSSNEAAYLLQLMMRAMGSNNLADCSDLCHAASSVGLKEMFGTGTSMVSLEGLKEADCVVLIGSNAPANHPRLMNELIQLRDRGGQVIVVNPTIEIGLVKFSSPAYPVKSMLPGGSEIASLYLQPIPGSDVALFVGIQKTLLEQGLADFKFLQAHSEDWEAVVAFAETTSWGAIEKTCGIGQGAIEQAALVIGQAKGVVFAWAMGVTQQENGVDNIFSIGNTALMTGNVGKLGAGPMPIRGHSNVQGFGSMGVTIRLRQEIQTALETLLNKPLSPVKGYDTRALIEAADQGKVDTLLCLGGNLYAANPDLTEAKRALGKIDTILYLSTKPNLGHFHGLAKRNTIIIPVLTRFENPHRTTTESGNNFVRLNDSGSTHLKGTLVSEVEFLANIAHQIHGNDPIDWRRLQDTEYIRQLIAQTIPGYEKIGNIDRTQEEFTIGDRIFTQPKFPTASGKAKMFVTPLPDLIVPSKQDFGLSESTPAMVLVLNTGRSYGQHNTVVYNKADKYRGMPHRNCILVNAIDAAASGFQEHQRVTVQGNAGKLENVEIIYGEVRSGSGMMFYPEVNGIFKAKIDGRSGTPAYKRVPVIVFSTAL